ncbi:MAG: hypothetical protein JSR76_07420 [Verrucomicrobia bacterium]|nr:hypothetical protein [Verrucomicrobiota bacterium]
MATILRTPPTLTPLLAEGLFPSREIGKLGSHKVHKIDGDDPCPEALPRARRSVLREWIEKNSPALSPRPQSLYPPPSYIRVSPVSAFMVRDPNKVALSFTQQIVIPL